MRCIPKSIHRCTFAIATLAVTLSCVSISHADRPRANGSISHRDRAEILDLMARYQQYFDSGYGDAYASLYTEDGELNYPDQDGDGIRESIKGREALAAFTAKVRRERGLDHIVIHHLGNTMLVGIDPKHIRARTPVMMAEVDATRLFNATVTGYGIYEDDLVKTAAGWRIQKRSGDVYGRLPIPPEFLPSGASRRELVE